MNDGSLAARLSGERDVLLSFLAEHRRILRGVVLELSDEEARRSLVPSLTTPMGLLKHAIFVDTAWFECRFGGASRADAGIPDTVNESFTLEPTDTLAALAARYARTIERSDAVISQLSLDDTCTHPAMGKLSLRWVLTHCIRELAQHAGHAEILVEQIKAGRV